MAKFNVTAKAEPASQSNPDPIQPYAVSRSNINKYFPGLSPKTLANLASKGFGPPFFKRGRLCFYLFEDLKNYVTEFEVKTCEKGVSNE